MFRQNLIKDSKPTFLTFNKPIVGLRDKTLKFTSYFELPNTTNVSKTGLTSFFNTFKQKDTLATLRSNLEKSKTMTFRKNEYNGDPSNRNKFYDDDDLKKDEVSQFISGISMFKFPRSKFL